MVDTDYGMLRLTPSTQQQYALWVLGLNAAFNLVQHQPEGRVRSEGGRRAWRAGLGWGGTESQGGTPAGSGSTGSRAEEVVDGCQLVVEMRWSEDVLVG